VHFKLIDEVIERGEDRLVAIKQVTSAEEYLQDHFPTFPVLPGVLMLEAMVQAARELIDPGNSSSRPYVLGLVRSLKYGNFVKPGHALRVEVERVQTLEDGSVDFKGRGLVVSTGQAAAGDPPPTAVSGRFSLRPARFADASEEVAARSAAPA
jgi:3-hydroxyacyl-[acyl-carrier-protein] dehydratase